MVVSAVFALALATGPAGGDAELEAKVAGIFEDECTGCHSEGGDPNEPDGLNLEVPPSSLAGKKAVGMAGKTLIAPGDPQSSYLLTKITGKGEFTGDRMPGEEGLPAAQVKILGDWIASMPAGEAGAVAATAGDAGDGDGDGDEGGDEGDGGDTDGGAPKKKGVKPFHGTTQVVLPTTTTLGRNTFQYRIDHRFGRIGTERGFLGLDAGVVMSVGIAYGILDGWDVGLRRTNSRKGWNLWTKYVLMRQEEGEWPISLGAYISLDGFRDASVENPVSGNFMLMLSRLWLDRWSTMLTFGFHLPTNHNARVLVDFDDGDGPIPVRDTRGTMTVGLASTVWLGKRKRWGIDFEYLQPIPDGGKPNVFYYRGGDADPEGTPIGSWSIGGSYAIGKHFFQLFVSNNREIHLNLAAPGGQVVNPFDTPGTQRYFINELNFFMGFNLGRRFTLGKNAAKWKKKRQEKKARKGGSDESEETVEDEEEEDDDEEPAEKTPPAPPTPNKEEKAEATP